MKKTRILFLDIEGGYGGSSRSLFYLLSAIDKNDILPEVWCRLNGPIIQKYNNLKIKVLHTPRMPHGSPVIRPSRNFISTLIYLYKFIRAFKFIRNLTARINKDIDIVHANHESLFFLVWWLKKIKRIKAPVVMHIRTVLPYSHWYKFQARIIRKSVDHLIFITKHEKDFFGELSDLSFSNFSIIHNSFKKLSPKETEKKSGGLNVLSLSNYHHCRGLDRLVDIAQILKDKKIKNIRFHLAGDMKLKGNLSGEIKLFEDSGRTFEDYVKYLRLNNFFVFYGHLDNVDNLLKKCDVLIKLTRENNPWGRDIIEGMAYSLPVMACGSSETFIKNKTTGFLYPSDDKEFYAADVVKDLIYLSNSVEDLASMSYASWLRINDITSPDITYKKTLAVWKLSLKNNEY